VAFCGGISSGFLGQRLMRSLLDEGIDASCVQRLDAPTSVCIVGLDARGVPAYDFYGERGADRQLDASVIERLPATTQALHFGSYAMVVEPVAGVQRAIVQRWHPHALIAYDPNVRLTVEPDLQRWRDTLDWMLPRTHLLKISDEDLDLLYPGLAPEAAARRWLTDGAQCVVITRGAHGALGFTAHAHAAAPPMAVQVVDTVGAGDTFQAALLAWLAEHDRLAPARLAALETHELAALLGFAARAAAITCSRRGADLPRRAELAPPVA
jgi:fructokinase